MVNSTIIGHAVWLYFRFCLSFRDVKELQFERGIVVSCKAIRKWRRKSGSTMPISSSGDAPGPVISGI